MVKDVQSVDLQKTPNGNLKITLRKGIRKLLRNQEIKTMEDLLEGTIANSAWEFVRPEEIGALTDCDLILSHEVVRDKHYELLEVGKVYWHERYQIEDPIQVLIETGELILICAD